MMKLIPILCSFLMVTSPTPIPGGEFHTDSVHMLRQAFDRYGNICWDDEKSRLDNFAIQLQDWPDWRGYVVVYAGRRSCRGEAQTRAERAKKWLVEKRGIEANRILLKDGGYREDVITELWMWPSDAGEFPVDPTMMPSEVKLVKGCKGGIYKPARCRAI